MARFLLVVLLHFPLRLNSLATSWLKKWGPGALSRSPTPLLDQIANSRDILSTDEINSLFLNANNLDSYSRRPDCFQRAIVTIRDRCGESELTELGRVRAAISMTLCELATAKHYSPPLECSPFSSSTTAQYRELDHNDDDAETQASCVEALSRSAQFWSSYSGYLREVPQLCFAYRRWNDIDTAKAIYLNATLEKLTLLSILKQREIRMTSLLERWESNLSDLSDLARYLRDSLMDDAQNLHGIVAGAAYAFLDIENKIETMLSKVEKEGGMVWTRLRIEMDESIAHTVENHAKTLDQVTVSLADSLVARFGELEEMSTSLIRQNLENFRKIFSELAGNVLFMARITNDTTRQLATNMETLVSQQHLQTQASNAIVNLTNSVSLLSSQAYSEMQRINETAHRLRDGLSLPPLYSSFQWWRQGIEIILSRRPNFIRADS